MVFSSSSPRTKNPKGIERRVVEAAEHTLAQRQAVTFIEVLEGMRWLMPGTVDVWRQGRCSSIEQAAQVRLDKMVLALEAFVAWAQHKGLKPSEVTYLSATRAPRNLQFTEVGGEEAERTFSLQWTSPHLSEKREKQLVQKQSKAPDLVVISALNNWTCRACSSTGIF